MGEGVGSLFVDDVWSFESHSQKDSRPPKLFQRPRRESAGVSPGGPGKRAYLPRSVLAVGSDGVRIRFNLRSSRPPCVASRFV